MPAIQIIKIRRDTAANFAATNPVIQQGEMILETDTGKMKIGVTPGGDFYLSLGYISTNGITQYTDGDAKAAAVADAIVDAVTDVAPSQNAVFDALGNKLDTSLKGAVNGLAELDAGGKIPQAQIPAIAITATQVAASEAAMLALTAQTGDVAVRTDTNETYILSGSNPALIGDWTKLLTPTDAVASVNGFTGVVVLGKSDVGLGNVDNVQQLPMSYLDTDTALAANSDTKVPSQKAIKAYVDGATIDGGSA